jgi:NADH-quinone oxidoreductase subunit A
MDYFIVFILIGIAFAMVFGALIISRIMAPYHPGGMKNTTYESGQQTIGPSWIQFNVGYYLIGLLFLIFDVEAAFLFPGAVVFRSVGLPGLIEIALFIFVLFLGLIYAWKKGVINWV